MKKLFLILTAFSFLGGCASMMNYVEDPPKAVARGVDKYCEETDPKFQTVFSAEVNARTRHSIQVDCVE